MDTTRRNWQKLPRLPLITKKQWQKITVDEEQAPGAKDCVYIDIGADGEGRNAQWRFRGAMCLHNNDLYIAGTFIHRDAESGLQLINSVLDNVSDWYSRLL